MKPENHKLLGLIDDTHGVERLDAVVKVYDTDDMLFEIVSADSLREVWTRKPLDPHGVTVRSCYPNPSFPKLRQLLPQNWIRFGRPAGLRLEFEARPKDG